MSSGKTIRKYLALLAALTALGSIGATTYFVLNVTIDRGIQPLPFNDVTAKSIDARLALAQTLFQFTLLMIGALWGLAIAKQDEIGIQLKERAHLVIFVSASVVLIFSVFAYGFYVNKIASQLADAVRSSAKSSLPLPLFVPDIFDQNVNYLFTLQIVNLSVGIFNGVLTLFSAHTLKEVKQDV